MGRLPPVPALPAPPCELRIFSTSTDFVLCGKPARWTLLTYDGKRPACNDCGKYHDRKVPLHPIGEQTRSMP